MCIDGFFSTFLYHCVSEPCTGRRQSVSCSNTNQIGFEIDRPDFLPLTVIVISLAWTRCFFSVSFCAGMFSPLSNVYLESSQRSVFGEHLFCHHRGAHGTRPTGIESQMCDYLNQLFFCYAVLHSVAEVEAQLIRTIHGNQGGDRCKTAVTLGKILAFPDIAKKHAVGEIRELRRDIADHFLGDRRFFAHSDSFAGSAR